MRPALLATIYRKELLDVARDRRTLISMVVAPVAAVPLLMLAMSYFMSSVESKSREESVTVGYFESGASATLVETLKAAGFKPVATADLKAGVESKRIAAGIEQSRGESGAPLFVIYADLTRPASQMAASGIRSALDELKNEQVKGRLKELGAPESLLTPFEIKRVNIAPERRMAGAFWGSIIGYVVLLLMFSGGMYPTIDMTAGEKERRTLEVFLASPASRNEIVMGKLMAATTATFLTAALSVTSLVFSLRRGGFGNFSAELRQMVSRVPIDPATIALLFVVLVPTAVMAASIMIAVALFARSFKEAQSYLTPIIFLVGVPAIAGMLPGLELTPALAAIPIFNVTQLIKGIFLGSFSTMAFAITLASSLVYAGLAFLFAVRIFKNESVLFRT